MIRRLAECEKCGAQRYVVTEPAELIPGVPAPTGLYRLCGHGTMHEVEFIPDADGSFTLQIVGKLGVRRDVPLHAKSARRSVAMSEDAA